MYQRQITKMEAGQRLDRYLGKLLPEAGSGFLHKMLRKKNITLNGKKADGSEKVSEGDCIEIFFSEETLHKFMGAKKAGQKENEYQNAYQKLSGVRVIYENEHILIADKPVGMLSQKANQSDCSLNEWLIGYLLAGGDVTKEDLEVFKPSVCNRLDRNTSGIVLCAKSVAGAQLLGELLRKRLVRKYYRLYVKGRFDEEKLIEGYLVKDEKSNKVRILSADEASAVKGEKASYVKAAYRPVQVERDKTLVEADLLTGRPHQIRAQMAAVGHPLLGDYKYGDQEWNHGYRDRYHIKSQLLHAYKVIFPVLGEPFADISGKVFYAKMPAGFERVADDKSATGR